jgi:hypothetical protein
MNRAKTLLLFVLVIGLVSCAPATTSVPTETATPTSTFVPTPTSTPKPTKTPVPTPTPIYVTLGSPFSTDCGDGVPIILVDDSFNGKFKQDGFDQFHGHVDILPPNGCDAEYFQGEVIAPVSGLITPYYDNPFGFHLTFPSNTYPAGIEAALRFAGIQDPDLSEISEIKLNFGHVTLLTGTVKKGDSIGDLHSDYPHANPWKLGYQITFLYNGTEYMFTPTLFEHDPPFPWSCRPAHEAGCEPKPNYYAP